MPFSKTSGIGANITHNTDYGTAANRAIEIFLPQEYSVTRRLLEVRLRSMLESGKSYEFYRSLGQSSTEYQARWLAEWLKVPFMRLSIALVAVLWALAAVLAFHPGASYLMVSLGLASGAHNYAWAFAAFAPILALPTYRIAKSLYMNSRGLRKLSGVKCELESFYAYSTLDQRERELYNVLFAMSQIGYYRMRVDVDEALLKRIVSCVRCDHPLVDSYGRFRKYGDANNIRVSFIPDLSDKNYRRLLKAIDRAAFSCLSNMAGDLDEYEKSKHLYEWLAGHVRYSLITASVAPKSAFGTKSMRDYGQTVESALIDKSTLCAGYARAFQYLAQRCGMQCVYVIGASKRDQVLHSLHGWCLLRIGESYCYADPTWGDDYNEDPRLHEARQQRANWVDYSYLNMTTEQLKRKHVPAEIFPLPECDAPELGYFEHEGLCFDEIMQDEIDELIQQAVNAGKTSLQFSCRSSACFDTAKSEADGAVKAWEGRLGRKNLKVVANDEMLTIAILIEPEPGPKPLTLHSWLFDVPTADAVL